MALNPITLGIARPKAGSATNSKGSGQTLSPELRQKIFHRDNHVCQFCGFQSQKYQDIHFIDNNPNNLQEANLATACIYCHQCFNIDKASAMRSAALIWLPEIEQGQLHHIARAIYVAQISQGTMADAARTALETLMSRKEEAQSRLGTDDPYLLSIVMQDFLSPKHYAMRGKKLDGIRLFPLNRRIIKEGELEFNQFPQILAYWRSKDGPFGGKIPAQWKNLYADIQKAA